MEQPKEPEVWKPVPDYEGLYEVSNYGRVKSLPKRCNMPNGGFRESKPKILKGSLVRGYGIVSLKKTSLKYKHFKRHRLVALLFLDNPGKLNQVNHIDSDKSNNYYKNLEWVNHRENQTHRYLKQKTSSKFPGVTYKKDGNRSKRWYAQISYKGNHRFIGSFYTEEAAYEAYLNALKKYGLKNKYAKP